jgi:bifunctional UDP-N-acetylglucosamine pyrophosphorylase/glucosamine-1-phosphate N-acetyltransferase
MQTQALLLAAGRSKRFWPLSDKNFLQFAGQTVIERQVDVLRTAGIKKIIIVGGKHNLVELKKLFPRETILEQKKLDEGMRGAVLTAEQYLKEPTLIISTNDVFGIGAVKKVLAAKNCAGALLAQKVTEYFPGGYLQVKQGRIISIIEKPKPGREPSDLINLVCHLFREPAQLIAALKKTKNSKDDGYERALATLFKTEKFIPVENSHKWGALKYPWHVLQNTQLYLDSLRDQSKPKIAKTAQIAKTAVIEGPVVIEAGAKVFDFAVIKGPVYLGQNTIVGTHSLVRDSIVGANSVVGSGSEVARSYLAENVWLHRNYVGDSVLADNVSLGAGAVTGNLRLDENSIKSVIQNKKIETGLNKFGCVIGADSRIGINTSLMPGVLIGVDSFIGSGLIISANLPNQSFISGEIKLKQRKNKFRVLLRGKN